jgi:hypothetical protein
MNQTVTKKIYAGVGSRETPKEILELMKSIALELEQCGYILRSGKAIGADQAFESGAKSKDIFLKEDATYEAMELSSRFHPYWRNLKNYEKQLHGRNAQILLGRYLNETVDFVICWTTGGKAVGGTGQAIRIAQGYGIKVYNLAINKDKEELFEFLNLLKEGDHNE